MKVYFWPAESFLVSALAFCREKGCVLRVACCVMRDAWCVMRVSFNVFNLTRCVPPGKITQSWKKTRARARATFWISSSIPRGGVVSDERDLNQKASATECYKWRWIPSIVWRSTDQQFFYSPIRRAWSICTPLHLQVHIQINGFARGTTARGTTVDLYFAPMSTTWMNLEKRLHLKV